MHKSIFPLAVLATTLLVSPAVQAQQTVVKTKNKTAKNAKATAAALPLAPPPVPGAGPAGPTPPPPSGPHGERGPGPKGPKGGPYGPQGGQAQILSDLRGTITAYQARNDEQVYDAFVLRAEGNAAADTIRFPRHLGQQLMAAAKAGSTVTVTGFRQAGPNGRSDFHFVSLTSGSQTVRNMPPARPATPPTEETATVRGTIQELRRDPKGQIKALTLSDQSILQLPPRAVEQLTDKLTVGASLEATGTLRAAHAGEALATSTPTRVVRAETLTLGGNKYLIR
jgi:hypothetical protein